MSETVAVAMITAGASFLIATGGSVATYLAGRRQSEAEHMRMEKEYRREMRKEARRERGETYKECLQVLNRFEEMESAEDLSNEDVAQAWERYRWMRLTLQLQAPPPVVDALMGDEYGGGGINAVLGGVRKASWGALAKGRAGRWQKHFYDRRIPFKDAQRLLVVAMRDDVAPETLFVKENDPELRSRSAGSPARR